MKLFDIWKIMIGKTFLFHMFSTEPVVSKRLQFCYIFIFIFPLGDGIHAIDIHRTYIVYTFCSMHIEESNCDLESNLFLLHVTYLSMSWFCDSVLSCGMIEREKKKILKCVSTTVHLGAIIKWGIWSTKHTKRAKSKRSIFAIADWNECWNAYFAWNFFVINTYQW